MTPFEHISKNAWHHAHVLGWSQIIILFGNCCQVELGPYPYTLRRTCCKCIGLEHSVWDAIGSRLYTCPRCQRTSTLIINTTITVPLHVDSRLRRLWKTVCKCVDVFETCTSCTKCTQCQRAQYCMNSTCM